MDFCRECNNKVEPDSKFCGECGAKLGSNVPQEKNTFKADVKIAHTNETTEKMLKGLGGSISSVSNSANSKFLLIKNIILKLIKPIIFLLILGGIALGAIASAKYYYTEIYFEPQMEFYGVTLLDKKADIRLIKGAPDKEEKDFWGYKLSREFYDSDYDSHYVKNIGWLVVNFKEDTATKIFYIPGEKRYDLALNNNSKFLKMYSFFDYLSTSDKEFKPYWHDYNQILKRFGEPSTNSIADNKLTRTISYNDLNIFFTFEQGLVTDYGIFEGKF